MIRVPCRRNSISSRTTLLARLCASSAASCAPPIRLLPFPRSTSSSSASLALPLCVPRPRRRSHPTSSGGRSRAGTQNPAVRKMSSVTAGDLTSAAASKEAAGEIAAGTKTVNVIIKGKVQGVYYRDWTVSTAQQLGVDGWVRNLKDGSVEAVISGKAPTVDSFIEKCHEGPSAAKVSGVEVSEFKGRVPQGFEKKPTA